LDITNDSKQLEGAAANDRKGNLGGAKRLSV